MKVSVICPVLNEMRFIKGWLANVKRFASEIIIVDTGSTDGTLEYLLHGLKGFRGYPFVWPTPSDPYKWPEDEIRNWLIDNCAGDWIVNLDADELVNDDFIWNLENLPTRNEWLIGRFVEYQFWRDFNHLRKASIWPPVSVFKNNGHWGFVSLRNWRGMYPRKQIRLFRNIPEIRYTKTGNHCKLSYKNWGRLANYSPEITKNFNLPFFHYHFVYPQKAGENRGDQRNKKINLIKFTETHPTEIKYYDNSFLNELQKYVK